MHAQVGCLLAVNVRTFATLGSAWVHECACVSLCLCCKVSLFAWRVERMKCVCVCSIEMQYHNLAVEAVQPSAHSEQNVKFATAIK